MIVLPVLTNAVTKAWATLLGSQRELFISLARAERIPSCLSPSKICLRTFLPYILIILEVWPLGPSATRGNFLERQNMGASLQTYSIRRAGGGA